MHFVSSNINIASIYKSKISEFINLSLHCEKFTTVLPDNTLLLCIGSRGNVKTVFGRLWNYFYFLRWIVEKDLLSEDNSRGVIDDTRAHLLYTEIKQCNFSSRVNNTAFRHRIDEKFPYANCFTTANGGRVSHLRLQNVAGFKAEFQQTVEENSTDIDGF